MVGPPTGPGNPGGFGGTPIDAGSLSVTGGSPSPVAMSLLFPGDYFGSFANGYLFPGGQSYTITGNGGTNVKSFTVTTTAPGVPFTWTNMSIR
jgi:hypothetical protein